MPITDQTVVDGPHIQADGSRRGKVQFTFSDGRIITRNIRATDAAVWAEALIDLPSDVLTSVTEQDAEAAAETDDEVNDAPLGESSREQIAYAFLKKAYSLDDPYNAFLKFDKFNNYRVSKGWTLDQVVAGLSSVGLTQGEWDLMKAAYLYLSDAGRVTVMAGYAPILANWEARDNL